MREQDLHEHVKGMSDGELEAARRDIVTGLGFMTPANGMYAPANTFLSAIRAELAQRAGAGHGGQPAGPEAS
jgi:hypothetical protein